VTYPRLLLVVLAAVAASCGRPTTQAAPEARNPQPLPADVQAVAAALPQAAASGSPGAAAATEAKAAFTGEFVSPVRSELSPRISGRVGRVLVDAGARVRKGQPLLELETEYLLLDLERAKAEQARAQAMATDAGRDLERKQGLVAKESVSQAAFDRSRAGADQAEAALAGARVAERLAAQRLADAVLVAPVDGVVSERRADVGERLGDQSVAFVIEQVAPLKLRFRVPERYLAAVRPGQSVSASVDPYPGEAFLGHISVVGAAIDAPTRTFLVEAEFPNSDGRLRPGLFARVEAGLGAGR
jgi:membrane fusion protein, multidrug efflux system